MKVIAIISAVVFVAALASIAVYVAGLRDYSDQVYRWHADPGSVAANRLVRGAKLDAINANLHLLIAAVNQSDNDPESFRTPSAAEPTNPPKLKLISLASGVATVEVINAEHLTQRMGSTGANTFMAEATFTLTEHRDVQSVDFRFEEGDHAVPGLYARQDFLDRWKPVKE
ncbi:MAG: hypothetical protein IPN53_05715 [Comamonadaceae bacterium]|nr:hypothetical protein [Comamonadaceae bacterium]